MVEKNVRSKNTTAPTADSQAADCTATSLNHSCRGPSSRTYCRAPRNSASDATCSQSIRRSISGLAPSTLPSSGNSSVTAIPGTMFMKNSQRQSWYSVIQPPTVGPRVGASVETMPRIAGTAARFGPSNIAKPVANTSGTIAPPVKPCRALKAIIELMSHARPHSRLEMVKSAAEAVNSQRVDSAWDRNAASGIITISAIR